MRLLLDTHIFIGLIGERSRTLTGGIRRLVEDPAAELNVSVASLWEIAIKSRLGKLVIAVGLDALPELIDSMAMRLIPIIASHVLADVEPEPPTRDPFDRLLLAQCRCEGLRLITLDRALISHPLAASGR